MRTIKVALIVWCLLRLHFNKEKKQSYNRTYCTKFYSQSHIFYILQINLTAMVVILIDKVVGMSNDLVTNNYRKTSNISLTLVGNQNVDNSDVVGASPVGAAPTTSSFST